MVLTHLKVTCRG